jgi:4-hydroxybenzoate polyprenyltransferase
LLLPPISTLRHRISQLLRPLLGGWLSQLRKIYPKLPLLLTLARFDRPIGIYLLLWPTLWGLWIASDGDPSLHLFLVFFLGTVLTRSAGCVINDLADRKFDGQVKRTISRPLVTGELEVGDAFIFLFVLMFAALVLVLTTNLLTLGLAVVAAVIAGIYPFMKRYTYLPQAVLGVAFSMGIPMTFSAVTGEVPQIAWLLVIANLIWTVAYDTQLAMVDRDDDLKLGLKSSAILFGDLDKIIIGILQISFVWIMVMIAQRLSLGGFFYLGIAIAAALLLYQQYLIKDRNRDQCFASFLNNHWVGLAVFAGIFLHFL